VSHSLHVALAGNPNSGKTSVLNALTGLRQRVGNYPGVTVEVREGSFEFAGHTVRVVDLPGTYSLGAPRSEDERVAREHLLHQRPDVVVNVVNTGNLARHLCFTLELLEAGFNLIVVLNFADEARRAGLEPRPGALSEALGGVPVVVTEGHRGVGAAHLKAAIAGVIGRSRAGAAGVLGEDAAGAGDEAEAAAVRRHALAGRIAAMTLGTEATDPALPDRVTASDRIDRVLVHRFWGLILFAAAMYAVFWVTFAAGAPLAEAIESGIAAVASALGEVWPSGAVPLLRSLLLEGVLGGVGSVLVFLPNIVLLFIGVSLLEDSGYMARAAFLVDRLMRAVGLQGRSFVPMIVGLGCSVPGIMAARTLDNERDRLATMFVVPLVPCGARVPIFLLLIPAFLPAAWRAPALMGVYVLGLALAALVARLLRLTALRGSAGVFVLELPPYRWPSLGAIAGQVWTRAAIYLQKAGTVILLFSVLMWGLSTFPMAPAAAAGAAGTTAGNASETLETAALGPAEALEYSFAGRLGKWLEPVFRPLGFDWRLNTALIGAMAAKELFVAQLGIIHAVESEGDSLSEALRTIYPPATGLAALVFALVASPCVATFAVMRREAGRRRWAVLQWVSLTALGYVLAAGVHLVATALGAG
jgi:ferrous iron transport protein B